MSKLEHIQKFDQEDFLEEDWLQILKEKKFIDDLLNGKGILLGTINQVEVVAEENPAGITAEVKGDT